jgi:hypothetical protein
MTACSCSSAASSPFEITRRQIRPRSSPDCAQRLGLEKDFSAIDDRHPRA